MQIEFYSKYGAAAELAIIAKTYVLTLVSGEFVTPGYWDFLDQHTDLENDSDCLIGTLLTETGMAIAKIETLEDIDTWLSSAQSKLFDLNANSQTQSWPKLMVAVFDSKGNIVHEDMIHNFPTSYTATQLERNIDAK